MTGEYPISRAGLAAALAALEGWASTVGLGAEAGARLGLVLDEIVGNLLMHDPSVGPEQRFRLELGLTDGTVRMLLSDPGQPFDPVTWSGRPSGPEGGLGLLLTRGLTSALQHRRVNGWNLLEVQLETG